jgi:hypothetical protein
MSAVVPLSVLAPALSYKGVAGSFASLEDTVNIRIPPVLYPDGTVVQPDELRGGFAQLSRLATAGSPSEIWDPTAKIWRPFAAHDFTEAQGIPLMPSVAASGAWDGLLIGVGAEDALGNAQFGSAVANFPQYRLRGVFQARRAGVDAFGLGLESAPLAFQSVADLKRFGIELTPDQNQATHVRLMLMDAAKRARGSLEIDASGNGVLTLANFDAGGGILASITLQADGDVRIAPASGGKVFIVGNLETGRIRYTPAGGGLPTDLT